jgi:hypothetical protein
MISQLGKKLGTGFDRTDDFFNLQQKEVTRSVGMQAVTTGATIWAHFQYAIKYPARNYPNHLRQKPQHENVGHFVPESSFDQFFPD